MPAAKQSKTGSLARLYSRPGSQSSIGPRGFHHLSFRRKREALLYVPEASADKAVALAVILHGAGGNAHHGLELLQLYADQANLILLAPESPKASWDIISDAQYGPMSASLMIAWRKCLPSTRSMKPISPLAVFRVALLTLSRSASATGLCSDIFSRFRPGSWCRFASKEQPRTYLSHATRDEVLPADPCGRKLVGVLREHRLPLTYREFDGPHTVPAEVRKEAVGLLTGRTVT